MSQVFWVDEKGNHASWPKQMLMLYFGRSYGDLPSLAREFGVFSYLCIVFSLTTHYLTDFPITSIMWFINGLVALHFIMCIYGYIGQRNVRANQYKYGYLNDLSLILQAENRRDYPEYVRLRRKWSFPPSQRKCDELEIKYDKVKSKLNSEIVKLVESNRRELFEGCSDTRARITLCRNDFKIVSHAISEVEG